MVARQPFELTTLIVSEKSNVDIPVSGIHMFTVVLFLSWDDFSPWLLPSFILDANDPIVLLLYK